MAPVRLTRLAAALVSGAVVLVAFLGVSLAQAPTKVPTIKTKEFQPLVSVEGKDNYMAYCAVCHGVNGKGHGPAVPALKVMVPDLTTMAMRRGEKFDAIAIERFIEGVDKVPAAHGSVDMPMWGPVFKSSGHQEVARLRLQNLVKYLGTLQSQS